MDKIIFHLVILYNTQGFEVNINDRSFFGFSDYKVLPNKGKWQMQTRLKGIRGVKYCVFSKIFKNIPDSGLSLFSLGVSVGTNTRQ